MNCDSFEKSVIDLVREGSPADSTEALEHARACPRCAQRLADEQALSRAMRLASADSLSAPAHVEAAVLAAYRRQRQTPLPVIPGRRFLRVLPRAIAAAALIGLLAVTAIRLINPARQDRSASVQPPAGTAQSPDNTAKNEAPAAEAAQAAVEPAGAVPASRSGQTGHPQPAGAGTPSPAEYATDFIPLTADAQLLPMESGQLVRILLPRTALETCGLPMNRDLADKPVQAQVLIGEDGVARAIRFLGDSNVGTEGPAKR